MQTYQEMLPTSRLARYIECYWSREDRDGTPGHCVLPDGCVDILFTSRRGEPRGLAVIGLMTARQVFDVEPEQFFFGVRFRPGMAAAFLPDAPLLNNKAEPLDNLAAAKTGIVLEQIAEASSLAEMGHVMDGFLRPLEPPDRREKILSRLTVSELSIDSLARDAGVSTRQLRRLCLESSGVSPKYLGRILRFRKAAERIAALAARPAQPNWAQLAAACGYYDQAHFIREFQEFSGCTPGRYLQYVAGRDQ